jgi:phospholipid/cholesterol/gamma-HCH transport system substrate-binding protein
MRDTRDHRFNHLEVKIGLFLFAAVLACVTGIYIIGVQSDVFSKKIQLYFTVENGSGFVEGLPVKLSGFRIGRLVKTSLNQDARVDVEIQILQRYQQWVRQDSKIRRTKESLVGDDILEIDAGSSHLPALEDGDTIGYERIKTLEEHAAEIADELKPVLIQVAEIIAYVNDPDGDFKNSLHNFQNLSRQLVSTSANLEKDIRATLARVDQTFVAVDGMLADSRTTINALHGTLTQVDSAVGSVAQNIPSLLSRLQKILDHLEKLSADLLVMTSEATPHIPPLLLRVDQVLGDTETLINAVQDVWLIRNNIPADPTPALEADSYE